MVGVRSRAKGDTGGCILLCQFSHFVCVDVSCVEARFIVPQEVRDDVGVCGEGGGEAKDMPLVCVVDERIIGRNLNEAVQKSFALVVQVGLFLYAVLIESVIVELARLA